MGRMNEKRLVLTVFGVLLTAITLYIASRFVAALTVAVFLYYSTRRFYKELDRLRLPARVRAGITLAVLAVPLLLLATYTLILVVVDLRAFVDENPVVGAALADSPWFDDVTDLPELTVESLLEIYRSGDFDPFIDFAIAHAGFVTSTITGFLINMLIIVVVTYYLLIDGSKAHDWLLTFDDDAIVREYLETADDELEAVLFGNLLNVIAISLIAIVVYVGYNALVPAGAEVPYPAIAGALTGIASLIPVVGMKVVYLPLAAATATGTVLDGTPELLVYVAAFLLVVVVLVDTIPDLILRPYLSGKRTHVGLLMLAYIFGPLVFGFYGLFLGPIILVLVLTFAQTAVPQLLGAEPEPGLPDTQRRIDDFL